MKKINSILLSTIITFFYNTPVYSYELGRINMVLSGEVVSYTCGVDVSQANKKVDLGRWALRQFKNAGDKSQPISFSFSLMNCPPSSLVNVIFTGKKDPQNDELLAIKTGNNMAQNVAIEILDLNNNRLPLDKKSPNIEVDKDGNGKALFYANYIATKNNPSAGQANADATFMVVYD